MKKVDIKNKNIWIWGGVLGGCGILVLFIYLIAKQKKKDKILEQASKNNSSASLAQQIHTALRDWDTDENYIIELGTKVCDLERLRTDYKTLYKLDLMTDLETSLNADEIQRFKDNVAINQGNCETGKDGKTTVNKNVRTPEYCNKISRELRIALGDGSYFSNVDENRLVELSSLIYDFDCVAKEYKSLYNQHLKQLIDDSFDSWESDLQNKFYSNIESNRNK